MKINSLYFSGTVGVAIKNNEIGIHGRMLNVVQFSDYVFKRVVITLYGAILRKLDIQNCSGGNFILGGDIFYLNVQLSCLSSAFNMEPNDNLLRSVNITNANIADSLFLDSGRFLRNVQFIDCNFDREGDSHPHDQNYNPGGQIE